MLSERQRRDLRRLAGTDAREVGYKLTKAGLVQGICPECRKLDVWWSTPAMIDRPAALDLVRAHLRARHSKHLIMFPPVPVVVDDLSDLFVPA